jgi:asparagine synthase (glutamine-hydrolysing)
VSKKLDEPLADASLLPTYRVSELARKHVKVALSGDGGDELFGGYPTYQAHIIAGYLNFLPNEVLDIFIKFLSVLPEKLVNIIPTSFKDYSKKDLAEIVLKGVKLKNPERHFYWMRTFFLGKETVFGKPDYELLSSLIPDNTDFKNPSLKGQFIDFNYYLRDDFLVKTDRASMYNSLEVRVPFLDNDVVDYAFSKSVKHVTLVDTKIELRKLLREVLPEISNRPKKGFGIPLADWMRRDLKDFIQRNITNKKLYDYIEKKKIDKLWKEHQSSEVDNSGTLWQLTVFSTWLTNWM